jgi:hypothetical protein
MPMASNQISFVLSLAATLVLVAGLQIFKATLASNQLLTILGGYLASLVFVFLLSAVSNLEMNLFGKQFQSKLFEVLLSLLISCMVASIVHRVSVTTCIIFSLIALHYLNRISSRVYSAAQAATALVGGSKKKR